MEENTVRTIIDKLAEWASQGKTVGPELWMNAASKLNVLLQGEQEELIDRKLAIAKLKASFMGEGDTAAKAKVKVEAMDEWAVLQKQAALIERTLETILLAKKNATLVSEMMRHQLS